MKVSFPEVIARGRRRLLHNALAVLSMRAATGGMIAFVLLLLLGTDIVKWRWAAALPIVGTVAGVLLVCRRRPTTYQTARLLDTRLRLADTLSTAVFFWPRRSPREADEETRVCQRNQAIRAAGTVDIRAALPMRIPRSVLLSFIMLTLLAAGLALLHYRIDGTLDLRRPALAVIQRWAHDLSTELAKVERSWQTPAQNSTDSPREDADSSSADRSDSDPTGTEPPEKGDTASTNNELAEKRGEMAGGGSQEQRDDPAQQQAQEGAERSADMAAARDQADAQRQEPQSSGQSAEQAGTNSSLFSRLSNSLANLASTLKSQRENASARDRAQDGASGKNRDGAASGEPRGAASRAAGPERDSAQSDGSVDAMSDQSGHPDPRGGSGAGRDEGNKDIQLAKQLEAMGKISVILGKRSRELTGDVSVEVASGRQQLKTAYEPRQAAHGTVDASADRDEIPIELEGYVQQYYREVRRQTGPVRKKK